MTLGITGVCWLPRMAEINSLSLNTGAHAIPIAAAGGAWGGLSAAWVDATTTVARVMAEIGVGLEGVNGLAVLARLGRFTVWAEQQAVMAGVMAGKAGAHATAYTVASIAMPSLPEIALVETARVAAYSSGGALDGAAEAAEAAKLALDIRAALVMETYEAATSSMVATPGQFLMPPPIAVGAGSADAGGDAFTTGGVTSAGSVASTAITAAANALTQPGYGTPAPAGAAATGVATTGVGGAALSTQAVSYTGGGSVSIGNGAGTLRLPEGWGPGLDGPGGLGNPSGATAPAAPAADPRGVAGTPASTALVRSTGTGSVLGQHGGDEIETRRGHDYGRSVEVFTDGRVVAPAVIGGDAVCGGDTAVAPAAIHASVAARAHR
ncbi:PPE domain-containing protein [Nocardia sp. NPDC005746]|uniref:PPE domain-containing protein n=1 Tax=Nocardia sp. NPDC005746 TaxID=3157062 RepID=UPI0033FCF4FB